MCGVAVKLGGLTTPEVGARPSSCEVLLVRYTLCVMDMLTYGDHSTEVHLLLLREYLEGRNTSIAGDPSSASDAVPRPREGPLLK